jgi:hypothetical protein
VLQERLQILAQSIRDTTDSAPHCYVGLDNEYQRRVTRMQDGLAVECWASNYSTDEPPPERARDAITLAHQMLAAIAADAAPEVAVALARQGYRVQR